MIEVELRSIINENIYKKLINMINKKNPLKETKQITYYFKGETDFRLMFTNKNLMLWLKEGYIHDEARNEMIVKIDNQYKNDLLKMLHILGYETEIKWFRIRNEGTYNNIKITIDYSYGYGYIFEAEIIVDDESKIIEATQKLNSLFKDLKINITDKHIFKNKYEDYKLNWQQYTNDVNEDDFLN